MRLPTSSTLVFAWLVAAAPPAMPAWVVASEFRESGTNHYLLTTSSDEAEHLHRFVTWGRTPFEFRVSDAPVPGLSPVCRFATTQFAEPSVFYTADATECENVKHNPNWTFEGEPFYAHPAWPDGSCPLGTGPVYRFYNQGAGGKPNHRLTPIRSERALMSAAGWASEGVAFCVPISPGVAYERVRDFAASEWHFIVEDQPNIVTIVSLPFDPPTPTGDDAFPYQAAIRIGFGFARWDPFRERIVVVFGTQGVYEQLVFPFAGGDAVEGCAFQATGVGAGPEPPPFEDSRFEACRPTRGTRAVPQ